MAGRGRGYASISKNQQPLRKPGEMTTLLEKFNGRPENPVITSMPNVPQGGNHIFDKICDRIIKVNLLESRGEMAPCLEEVKLLCNTKENLVTWVEIMVKYALRTKWNAHAIAVFSENSDDITVGGTKFRSLLLRKLQILYNERIASHENLDQFVLEATFACELFHHLRIEGSCIKVLTTPILDYLGMLVDSGTQKEVEVFIEQFPKFYNIFEEIDSSGLGSLLNKVRTQLISGKSSTSVKCMLLEVLESVISNFKPLNTITKQFYESHSKPVTRICC